MSFRKKSDVKNHLSTRLSTRRKTPLAFRPVNPPDVNSSGTDLSGDKGNTSGSHLESDRASSPPMRITPIDALIGSGTDAEATKKPQA